MLAAGLLTLVALDLVGELLAALIGKVVPSAVIGMLLALGFFVARRRVPNAMFTASNLLTRHLSLFFVPPGVAVMEQVGVIRLDLVPIVVAVVASTLIGLVTTAVVFQLLTRGRRPS